MIYLFDWDGTLMSTEIYNNIYVKIISYITKKYKLDKKFKNKIKLNENKKFDTGELCRELKEEKYYYEVLLEELNNQNYLFEETIPTLKFLKNEGHKIGIITNSFRKTIDTIIKHYNLSSYIDFIFSSDVANAKKSDKVFWIKLIKEHNLNPKDCFVEGDNVEEDFNIPISYGFNARVR